VAILRLKQAQYALSDGRLDEAFDLAQSDKVTEHQQGQKLLTDLAGRFTRRGRDHLDAGRTAEALADCEKAVKLAGNLDQVAELRRDVCSTISDRRAAGKLHAAHLNQAQHHLDNGRLSAGRKMLEGLTGDHAADLLKVRARGKQLELDDALLKANKALESDDVEAAVNIVLRTKSTDRQDHKLAEVMFRIKKNSIETIREKVVVGRVDLAESLLLKIETFITESIDLEDLHRTVQQCQAAAKWLHQGRPREAIAILEQLRTRLPEAEWIRETLKTVRETADGLDTALAGPLGLVGGESKPKSDSRSQKEKRVGQSPTPHVPDVGFDSENALPETFVLQIDGVGSFMVARNARVSIGPISHTQRPEIGLVAPADCPVAMIERNDSDYFIRSHSPIGLNDEVLKNKLLTEGDRVTLSNRCRFKFSRPNPASGTAKLVLSSARMGNPDIRQIILMDREIIIAANSAAHIQTPDYPSKITLVLQGDKLICQSAEMIQVQGQNHDCSEGLPFNRNLQIGQLSLIIKEV